MSRNWLVLKVILSDLTRFHGQWMLNYKG